MNKMFAYIIVGIITLYFGYLLFCRKKGDKKNDNSLRNVENRKHGKVVLNQNIDNKDINIQGKAIDGNNKLENKITNEMSSISINERLQDLEKKFELQEKGNKIRDGKIKLNEEENTKIKEENKKIKEENKKIKEELILTDLSVIIQKQEIKNLKNKNNMFLNAYKILYFRKIANILLEKIFVNYPNDFFITERIFKHSEQEKPGYKVNKFPIIIAKRKIGEFTINMINLLIDYLMYIKDFTSSFIHIAKAFPIQIEILFSIFGNYNVKKDENDNYVIEPSLLINTVLGDDNIQQKKDDIKENIEVKEEKIEDFAKENNAINNKIEDPKDKEKEVKEKKEGNLKGVKNNKKNGDMNGNTNSSENETYKNEEKEKEESSITNENNNLFILNEVQISKNIAMTEIDNMITSLKKNNQNFSENDIINKIKEIDLEKLLKEGNGFDTNELLKLKSIKELRDIINKNKDSFKEENIIDIYYIFKEWKNSFNQSYKAEEKFKKLVIYDEKIELDNIKKVASHLISSKDKENIIVFGDDPGDFKNIKFETLKEFNFQSYYDKVKK